MADRKDFNSEIIFASREITGKEKVMLKDTQDAHQINAEVTESGGAGILIDVDMYAKIHVHNEKATPNTDYDIIVLVDKNGEKWTTGSESFMRQFESIWEDMDVTEEPWTLKAYGRPSKNYAGRDFITCSVI